MKLLSANGAATGGKRWTVILVAMTLALPFVGPGARAWADYYFYGVAEDDFLDDNDILWDAMDDWPEWMNVSPDLQDNRYGKIVGGARDSIYEDLQWYADQVSDGDVFVFLYAGHGGWTMTDEDGDDSSTPRPTENDPSPDDPPPYEGDEYFGKSGGYYMTDDDFVAALADFDPGAELVLISGACHSGGWVFGDDDLDNSAPATNHGLYAMLGAPEHATGIGLKYAGEDYYSILLVKALANTATGGMTADDWFDAAVEYGADQRVYVQMPWDDSPHLYYWWPEPGAALDDTWLGDHWKWQETYLQLTPVSYTTLDADHDRPLFTPEPGTMVLAILGVGGLVVMRRRSA